MTAPRRVELCRTHGTSWATPSLRLEHRGIRGLVVTTPGDALTYLTDDTLGLMPGGATVRPAQLARLLSLTASTTPGDLLPFELIGVSATASDLAVESRPSPPDRRALHQWSTLLVRLGTHPEGGSLSATAGPRHHGRSLVRALLTTPPEAVDVPVLVATTLKHLVGVGPGTTPSGDDVIVGVFAALAMIRDRARIHQLTQALTPRLATTTRASRHFLNHAISGHFAEPVVRLAAALHTGRSVAEAVSALQRWGATSGVDLMHGMAAVLTTNSAAAAYLEPHGRAS